MEKQFTTSVYIVHNSRVLLLLHPKFKKWLPPGGHIERNESPPEAAKREVKEETNLEVSFIKQENIWVQQWNAKSFERPFLCLAEHIPAFGSEAPHQHLDFIYLASPIGSIIPKGDDPLKWFSLDEVEAKNENEMFVETQDVIKIIFEQEAFIHQ